MSVPASKRWVAKLWRRVCTVTRFSTDRAAAIAPGKQPSSRFGQPPIDAQNLQQLRRRQHIAVLAALALLDANDHPAAIDIRHLQTRRRTGGHQSDPVPRPLHGLQKAGHLIGAQHDRQLARRPGVSDPLRQIRSSQRHAVEETQGANGLVQRAPRDPSAHQVGLIGVIGAHLFISQLIG